MSVFLERVSCVLFLGLLLRSYLPQGTSTKYTLDMATSLKDTCIRNWPNLALKKPSRISSLWKRKHVAGLANDGNTNGNLRFCACTAEYQYKDNWWTVDLGATYWVVAIELWNRANSSFRLTHFDVIVTDVAPPPAVINDVTLCYHHGSTTIPANIGFFRKCRKPIAGNHLTISKKVPSTEHLTLCEVRVFGLIKQSQAVDGNKLTKKIHVRSLLGCSVRCLEIASPCIEYDYNEGTGLCRFEEPKDRQIFCSASKFEEYHWNLKP
ncbi:uncharacterized protein LOC135493756 [Lineus longissimus]|uniref:uncharacterized protein LOC135493756 n=1 Tax=Lineus longissimus TaxID=88925 RepID=UPI00315C8723